MKLKIFSIFDSKAKAYLPPWFLPSEHVATRTFGDCCNDQKHAFGHHPEDYTLFQIGEFEDETGVITYEIDSQVTVNGVSLVKQQPTTGEIYEQKRQSTPIQPSTKS